MNAATTPNPRKERNTRLNQDVGESDGIVLVGFSIWNANLDSVPEPYGLCFLYLTGRIDESHPLIDDFWFNNSLYKFQRAQANLLWVRKDR